MARTTTGIDIGRHSAKLLRGQYKGGTFHVSDFVFRPGRGDDVGALWSQLDPGFKPTAARVGLTGRDVNIRYTQVPRVPDWQLRKLMRFEVEEIGDQSGSEVASDFNLLPTLPEIEHEDVCLLAMARESLLEQHIDGLKAVGGKLDAFTPNSLALYVAWLRYGAIEEETVLLANIGHDNLDVILVRGPDLLFARNLSGGSKLFDDAVAQRFGVSAAKAEELKKKLVTLEPGATHRDANGEKASRACTAPAGQLLSLLQSTVMFCRSQVKIASLKVDRVLLCGGGARLRGLERYVGQGMGVPCERFDPFRVVDTDGLDAESADLLRAHQDESVVALGLATMASDADAYSIEILPSSVRRARDFFGRTAFLIAAGLLGVLFLGYHAWNQSRQLGQVETDLRSAQSKVRRATGIDQRAKETIQENAELKELADELFAVAGSGEQIARTVIALRGSLPAEFWIQELSSEWSFDEDWGVDRGSERPILHLEGRAREGTESMASLYESFLAQLNALLPGARLKQRPSPSGDKFTVDMTLLAPADPEAAADTPSGDDDEETGS